MKITPDSGEGSEKAIQAFLKEFTHPAELAYGVYEEARDDYWKTLSEYKALEYKTEILLGNEAKEKKGFVQMTREEKELWLDPSIGLPSDLRLEYLGKSITQGVHEKKFVRKENEDMHSWKWRVSGNIKKDLDLDKEYVAKGMILYDLTVQNAPQNIMFDIQNPTVQAFIKQSARIGGTYETMEDFQKLDGRRKALLIKAFVDEKLNQYLPPGIINAVTQMKEQGHSTGIEVNAEGTKAGEYVENGIWHWKRIYEEEAQATLNSVRSMIWITAELLSGTSTSLEKAQANMLHAEAEQAFYDYKKSLSNLKNKDSDYFFKENAIKGMTQGLFGTDAGETSEHYKELRVFQDSMVRMQGYMTQLAKISVHQTANAALYGKKVDESRFDHTSQQWTFEAELKNYLQTIQEGQKVTVTLYVKAPKGEEHKTFTGCAVCPKGMSEKIVLDLSNKDNIEKLSIYLRSSQYKNGKVYTLHDIISEDQTKESYDARLATLHAAKSVSQASAELGILMEQAEEYELARTMNTATYFKMRAGVIEAKLIDEFNLFETAEWGYVFDKTASMGGASTMKKIGWWLEDVDAIQGTMEWLGIGDGISQNQAVKNEIARLYSESRLLMNYIETGLNSNALGDYDKERLSSLTERNKEMRDNTIQIGSEYQAETEGVGIKWFDEDLLGGIPGAPDLQFLTEEGWLASTIDMVFNPESLVMMTAFSKVIMAATKGLGWIGAAAASGTARSLALSADVAAIMGKPGWSAFYTGLNTAGKTWVSPTIKGTIKAVTTPYRYSSKLEVFLAKHLGERQAYVIVELGVEEVVYIGALGKMTMIPHWDEALDGLEMAYGIARGRPTRAMGVINTRFRNAINHQTIMSERGPEALVQVRDVESARTIIQNSEHLSQLKEIRNSITGKIEGYEVTIAYKDTSSQQPNVKGDQEAVSKEPTQQYESIVIVQIGTTTEAKMLDKTIKIITEEDADGNPEAVKFTYDTPTLAGASDKAYPIFYPAAKTRDLNEIGYIGQVLGEDTKLTKGGVVILESEEKAIAADNIVFKGKDIQQIRADLAASEEIQDRYEIETTTASDSSIKLTVKETGETIYLTSTNVKQGETINGNRIEVYIKPQHVQMKHLELADEAGNNPFGRRPIIHVETNANLESMRQWYRENNPLMEEMDDASNTDNTQAYTTTESDSVLDRKKALILNNNRFIVIFTAVGTTINHFKKPAGGKLDVSGTRNVNFGDVAAYGLDASLGGEIGLKRLDKERLMKALKQELTEGNTYNSRRIMTTLYKIVADHFKGEQKVEDLYLRLTVMANNRRSLDAMKEVLTKIDQGNQEEALYGLVKQITIVKNSAAQKQIAEQTSSTGETTSDKATATGEIAAEEEVKLVETDAPFLTGTAEEKALHETLGNIIEVRVFEDLGGSHFVTIEFDSSSTDMDTYSVLMEVRGELTTETASKIADKIEAELANKGLTAKISGNDLTAAMEQEWQSDSLDLAIDGPTIYFMQGGRIVHITVNSKLTTKDITEENIRAVKQEVNNFFALERIDRQIDEGQAEQIMIEAQKECKVTAPAGTGAAVAITGFATSGGSKACASVTHLKTLSVGEKVLHEKEVWTVSEVKGDGAVTITRNGRVYYGTVQEFIYRKTQEKDTSEVKAIDVLPKVQVQDMIDRRIRGRCKLNSLCVEFRLRNCLCRFKNTQSNLRMDGRWRTQLTNGNDCPKPFCYEKRGNS